MSLMHILALRPHARSAFGAESRAALPLSLLPFQLPKQTIHAQSEVFWPGMRLWVCQVRRDCVAVQMRTDRASCCLPLLRKAPIT